MDHILRRMMKLCDNEVHATKTFRCTISGLEPHEKVIFFSQIPLTKKRYKSMKHHFYQVYFGGCLPDPYLFRHETEKKIPPENLKQKLIHAGISPIRLSPMVVGRWPHPRNEDL